MIIKVLDNFGYQNKTVDKGHEQDVTEKLQKKGIDQYIGDGE